MSPHSQTNSVLKFLRYYLLSLMIFMLSSCSDFFNSKNTNFEKPKPDLLNEKPPEKLKDEDKEAINTGEVTEEKVLLNLGYNVFFKQANDAVESIPNLRLSIDNYCKDLGSLNEIKLNQSNPGLQKREQQMKFAWEQVMYQFQKFTAVPFGPLLDKNNELFYKLYSWPFLNQCAVDKDAVKYLSEKNIDIESMLFNQKGLGAIEYLIYENNTSCNLRAHPDMKSWMDKSLTLRKKDRCEWALKLVDNFSANLLLAQQAWSAEKGNYAQNYLNTQKFKSTAIAINQLTDSMSHIEFLKDKRLGRPLGLHRECTAESCPEDVEHKFSGLGLVAIEAQLEGFKEVFFGLDEESKKSFAVDDLLIKAGKVQIVEAMRIQINEALKNIKKLNNQGVSLQAEIEKMDLSACKQTTKINRGVEICAIHQDVREVARLLKQDVLLALSLRAPPTHQGDND